MLADRRREGKRDPSSKRCLVGSLDKLNSTKPPKEQHYIDKSS